MDIQGLSMDIAQSRVMDAVGTKVLSMSLDRIETAGDGLVEMMNRSMMEHSVNPNLGGNMDLYV